MHSKNAELLAAIRAGDALVTGLAGETWARLITGDSSEVGAEKGWTYVRHRRLLRAL